MHRYKKSSVTVAIRKAKTGDFDFVSRLMTEALKSFYDGDHQAHARRIFTAHINSNIDSVGQFSLLQYIFIAEVNHHPAGMIHLVVKKQGTVKISPLIVAPEYRGKFGIGSKLLRHAEDFARKHHARQLYCTVAAQNQDTLKFLLRKGFHLAGKTQDHYKPGIDECMLYKPLGQSITSDLSDISIVPFDEKKHTAAARQLILSRVDSDFNGVDDTWVDALFASYQRRESRDVNAKYKLIFIAEQDRKVVGVVVATPKKGQPIKIMPLVVKSGAVFEVLVANLPRLLAGYGRKLYIHLVPEPWQVACLQRHGWTIEGLFPEGYAPNSVVQQWGISLNKKEVPMRKMRIKRPYYDAIMSGRKTLEVRIGYNSIKRLKEGQLLQLENGHASGVVRIKSIRIYSKFADMLAAEPWQQIVPQAKSQEEALRLLHKIYPPHKERLGVHVIEIEKQDSKLGRLI